MALKERKAKKKIKETKLKFKEALKKINVEKLEETGDHLIEIKQLKDLSSELKTAMDDFMELDDSECEDYWMSFLCFGWCSGRTIRQIYRSQDEKTDLLQMVSPV